VRPSRLAQSLGRASSRSQHRRNHSKQTAGDEDPDGKQQDKVQGRYVDGHYAEIGREGPPDHPAGPNANRHAEHKPD